MKDIGAELNYISNIMKTYALSDNIKIYIIPFIYFIFNRNQNSLGKKASITNKNKSNRNTAYK
jgi:hypothetical protein